MHILQRLEHKKARPALLSSQKMAQSSNSVHMDTVPLIIAGKDVLGANRFPVNSPGGECVWDASGASVDDAEHAAKAAQEAFMTWSKTKPAVRRDIFLRAADIFRDRYAELAQCQKDETGAESLFVDWILQLTIDNLKEVAGKCSMVMGSIPQSDNEGRGAFVLKEPYGVILGIAPWYVLLIPNRFPGELRG